MIDSELRFAALLLPAMPQARQFHESLRLRFKPKPGATEPRQLVPRKGRSLGMLLLSGPAKPTREFGKKARKTPLRLEILREG